MLAVIQHAASQKRGLTCVYGKMHLPSITGAKFTDDIHVLAIAMRWVTVISPSDCWPWLTPKRCPTAAALIDAP